QPFILAGLLMVVVLHSIASAARLKSEFILATMEVIVFGSFMFCNSLPSPPSPMCISQADALRSIPRDMKTALSVLEVEPEIVEYACC
ncbi:hypothetical protein C8Q76DRAFT_571196, partial [Earliella scabrosa]